MNKIDYKKRVKIYAGALDVFGRDHQLTVALEELSEVQKEICKVLRGEGNLLALAEEIADATIMLEQVRQIFDINDEVCGVMDYKVARLQSTIKKERAENGHS
jgi:hypothetical protein